MRNLTTRESDILKLTCQGNRSREIASKLGISNQVVKNHLSTIRLKLNANTTAHAVAIYIRGVINDPGISNCRH